MLNHTLMTFDEFGRIRCTLEIVDKASFNGGTPIKDGLVCITGLDVEAFLTGLGYLASGNICSEQVEELGLPLAGRNGKLRTTSVMPAFWYCGLPFGANGRLAIIVEDSPDMPNGFSNGFDDGGFK